jgi:hypothetical protein
MRNGGNGHGGTGIKTPTLTDSCSDWIKWINKQVNKFQIMSTYLNELSKVFSVVFSLSKNFWFRFKPVQNGFRGFGNSPNRERNRWSSSGQFPKPEPQIGVQTGPVWVWTEVWNRTFPSLELIDTSCFRYGHSESKV